MKCGERHPVLGAERLDRGSQLISPRERLGTEKRRSSDDARGSMDVTRAPGESKVLSTVALAVLSAPAQALTLSESDRTALAPGVELVTYRTSDPTTDTRVLEVDLCADGVRIDATRTPTSTQTVSSWAGTYGPVAAVNGDFFRTSPVRVYGDAVGGGVP